MGAAFVEATWAPTSARPAAAGSRKGGWEEVEDSKLMLELMLSSVDRSSAPISGVPAKASTATAGALETLDLLGGAAAVATATTTAICDGGRMQLDIANINNMDCSTFTPDVLDLDGAPLPPGWQKCLDLQTGRMYYVGAQSHGCNTASTTGYSSPGGKLPSRYPPAAAVIPSADAHTGHLQPNTYRSASCTEMLKPRPCRVREWAAGAPPCPPPSSSPHAASVSVFGVDLNSPPQLQEFSWAATSSAGALAPCSSSSHGVEVTAVPAHMTTVGCANCLMFVMLSMTDPRCPNCGSCAVMDFCGPLVKRTKTRH